MLTVMVTFMVLGMVLTPVSIFLLMLYLNLKNKQQN